MLPVPAQVGVGDLVLRTLYALGADVLAALPSLLAGLVFLVIAFVVVKLVMVVVRGSLERALPAESPVYRRFVAGIVALFLWFGVALSFLTVVGLGNLAASLGTASGFLALGVAYALSDMIEDAVAGVYLLRDPDFNPGDEVTVGDMSGVVSAIELRKTRFSVDGDTVVRGNADIEKRWRKRGAPADAGS
ncbi:MAG TPA: mechanosensitive ion channel domain-containing protein [Halobacteriales archaeon]|nr:mechanosensitive ion channel domain-containing protein [Halobacteriales archaeon]